MKKEKSAILIVDDIPDNVEVLNDILSSPDYIIESASDGVQALEKIANNKYDLILLDIMMPGMDGLSVCKKLKDNPETENIPVIFITAKSGTNEVVKGFKAGAVDYITKPFSHREVKARVNTHIELKKTRDTLEKEYLKEKKLAAELKEAISKIKTLTGLLPICSYCFKIKDDDGYWQRVDSYIRDHSDVEFSHGICNDCKEKLLKDLNLKKSDKKKEN